MAKRIMTLDGNEAAASVAYRASEVIAIYPITPSSPMGEFSDEWASKQMRNIWGTIPQVTEMQSEGGAAGAVHGALQAGALATTFTASQGLLLMIPNMYKIAGELTAFCMHVTARTLATHALSIFGDHSDVMACRQIGFAMLCSGSVQEAHDLACVAHAATLKSRIPFLHFFDGFRTSHEVSKIEMISDEDLLFMMDQAAIKAHRERALTPDNPKIRGTAQNPDTFFQTREACNKFFDACPDIVQQVMDQFGGRIGRKYNLFDYVGAPDAERVMVMMGSGAETAHETADYLVGKGEKIGLVKVRLFRPFSIPHLVKVLPKSVKKIAVLDRTKEPGGVGEPLYQDVVAALREAKDSGKLAMAEPTIIGGRYGLSSKEFTPAMVKAVYDELAKASPKRHFTVGINDDVTRLSLDVDEHFDIEGKSVVRAVFFGLGADGTVGANKNSIKIIGEETDNFAQGYFVYDSKKSGAMTISHLRFGPGYIRPPYLISKASFVACHQFVFLEKYDVLCYAAPGATFLLNAPYPAETVWDHLPLEVQEEIIAKKLKFYVIDGYEVAKATGMGSRVNTIMQTCFFAISGVLQKDEAITKIKETIKKTYGKKGDEVVKRNYAAVDDTVAHLHEVKVPAKVTATFRRPPVVSEKAPSFVREVIAPMMAFKGDLLPVSAFPPDGTYDTATTQWEKRSIALEIPIWDPAVCIQCNKCAIICPHAAIRSKVYAPSELAKAPEAFRSADYKAKDFAGMKFTIQVAPEDCTGCKLCVQACPAKDKSNPKHKAINMEAQLPLRERERANYDCFLAIPDPDRSAIDKINVKSSQFFRPLFEYSGACAGCGETPYVKLLSQLFGDRLMIGNATGCSSIYGGNLPTTPYCKDANGRGPAWANSLFEDNAEFGFGMRAAIDKHHEQARELVAKLAARIGDNLASELLNADQATEAGIKAQRDRVAALKAKLATIQEDDAARLAILADYLVRKSVWMLGGDGWAYDIGYGGLDHVLSLPRDVNILVLDTEVYSNTGGQASKSTPIGAAAKFASAGKSVGKKDLGLMAMSYGHVYVASVAIGAKDTHTVQAFVEAESYPGPSIIIAYSHCIAHGYDLAFGLEQQKLAVNSGVWPLYRYDPRRVLNGEPPLILDSVPGETKVSEYMRNETRFRMVEKMNPERFQKLSVMAAEASARRLAVYDHMAKLTVPKSNGGKSE
ncbi:MAG TPA: pyruvate:ferredoxin (flavodoxin) oxidoreductase [Phycisphaerae bacterium]|nr:pyruvate:ferredoxin (flavodoxin) oxidoreductase [Phycisphaerae bacterium]HRY68284.1 pyruvate:ferredoxin (flavodoxin) oxidoreductase [Phycisphaerae bacterium]HSA26833.1 pyruvate:ferredoxin (flavodoxin) oxidoreductase [Phycisphaerae bacterium]